MKTLLVFFLGLICLCLLLFFLPHKSFHSTERRLVGNILQRSSKIIKTNFNLIPSGSGVAMPGGPIRELFLAFDSRNSLSKEELRKLLISSANIMLEEVNNDKEIEPYLYVKPFTINNIEVVIYIYDKNGQWIFDPNISTASISNGQLTFFTVDSQNISSYKNEYEETYEEAIKAISEESN